VAPASRLLIFLLAAFNSSMSYAADYEGTAAVVDGDTIALHVADKVISVRLCGIDSPEARHAGGPEASAKMAEIITGKEVQCVQVGGGTCVYRRASWPCQQISGRARQTEAPRSVSGTPGRRTMRPDIDRTA
jgi:hypothetical protein